MTLGIVRWFNPHRGFGFIRPESGGKDVFLHPDVATAAGLENLTGGERVSFDETQSGPGSKLAAENLRAA